MASVSTDMLYYFPLDLTVNVANTKSKTSFFDLPYHILRNRNSFIFVGYYGSISLLLLLRNIPNKQSLDSFLHIDTCEKKFKFQYNSKI